MQHEMSLILHPEPNPLVTDQRLGCGWEMSDILG